MIHPPRASFVLAPVTGRAWPDEGPGGPVRALTWLLAALVIAGVHAGIYRTLTHAGDAEPPPPPVTPAAVMVNLAPIPVTARSEVDNQADGPPSTASEEATPPEPPPPTEIAVPVPPPPEVTPQAVLPAPPPKPEQKRVERPPEKRVQEAKPRRKPHPPKRPKPRDEDRAAARNGGGPRSDRQTADRTAAPTTGDAGGAASRAEWQSAVRSRIVRAKRFPSEAHGVTGVATVSVTFTAGGAAGNVRLVASSGNAALDAEAVAVMARAGPYPPPPGGRPVALTIPLNFRR